MLLKGVRLLNISDETWADPVSLKSHTDGMK